MDGERYVGERRALRHFLQELRPLVVAALGPDSVLRYRIERALQSGELAALRKAREIFHNQPEELKRRLMRGIFEAPAQRPTKSGLLQRYTLREPEPFVRFDAYPAASSEEIGLSVELDHELAEDVPVRVLISPGTLPSSAAEALRQIAAWIERDRRLLSARHWHGPAQGVGVLDQARLDDTAEDRHGGNLDQA
ncbi:MAG: hypothetical protein ACREH3_00305 [Geminicoccales bacterium]